MTGVVLTGFMGTGKSTIGRRLADTYGLPLIDLDAAIEQRAGASVSQIFATHGEEAFRDLETEVLRAALAGDPEAVISTGGGALLRPENRALLGTRPTVCLVCSPSELRRRLERSSRRPLLEGGGEGAIERLLMERAPVYSSFPQVHTEGRVPDDVADEVARLAGLQHVATLRFERADRSRLHFGRGLVDGIGPMLATEGVVGRALLVTDSTVAGYGLADGVLRSLERARLSVHLASVPAGEDSKSLAALAELYRTCMAAGMGRSDTIVAVGGGMICDLAGFLAATYMRGLRLVSVPTTLLAQVDAAIGGKVGVDVEGAKNLAGAFYPASHICIDPDTLRSAPARLLSHGLAEMVKIGVVRSAPLLGALEGLSGPNAIHRQPQLIRWSAREKVEVVAEDPYERQAGAATGEGQGPAIRALLNFGHTMGHALEAASRYRLAHGEAVSIGMVAEARLAADAGYCPGDLPERLETILARLGLPTVPPAMGLDEEEIVRHLYHDKKAVRGVLRFALPTGPGSGAVFSVHDDVARRAIRDAMRRGRDAPRTREVRI